MRPLLLAACAAAVLIPSSGLAAETAECLWRNIPAATKDELLVAYKQGRNKGLSAVRPEVDFAMASRCIDVMPTTAAEAEQLGRVVGAQWLTVTLEKASASRLAELGYPQRSLDQAWESIGPEKRALIRSGAKVIDDPTLNPPPETGEAVVDAAEAAGMPMTKEATQQTLLIFTDYFTSRAIREALEAR